MLKGIRPSYLILLAAFPFVIYLFWSFDDYQAALAFIAPGIGTTVLVTVLAYIVAGILGLGLAGLLIIKTGKGTMRNLLIVWLILVVAGVWFFTRPQDEYALIGDAEGLVAIISGTPARYGDMLQSGAWREDAPTRNVRAVVDADAAIQRLEDGIVTGAFVPVSAIPAGVPVLFEARFLPRSDSLPAIFFTAVAAILGILMFAGWQSGKHPFAIFAELYVDMIRGIPMLVIVLYIGFPVQGAVRELTGGLIEPDRITRGVVAIALGYAAYMAEIFRAGIQAVAPGQLEASRSLGLTGWQTARFVVLPQALKIVIPPLGNEFIAMLKDTSLLSLLSLREVTQRSREYTARTFEYFPGYNTAAIVYIGLTLAASSALKYVERRSDRSRPVT